MKWPLKLNFHTGKDEKRIINISVHTTATITVRTRKHKKRHTLCL